MTDDTDELLTPKEVALVLRLSRPTVNAMCRDGRLPACAVGRSWRIRRSDLDAWLAAQRVERVTP